MQNFIIHNLNKNKQKDKKDGGRLIVLHFLSKKDKNVVAILSAIVYNTKQCEVRREKGEIYHG